MKIKGIEIVQLRNKNLFLKLPNGGQSVIGCKKFMNTNELKEIVENFLKKNPIEKEV